MLELFENVIGVRFFLRHSVNNFSLFIFSRPVYCWLADRMVKNCLQKIPKMEVSAKPGVIKQKAKAAAAAAVTVLAVSE